MPDHHIIDRVVINSDGTGYRMQGESQLSGRFGEYCLCRLCAYYSKDPGFCPMHDILMNLWHNLHFRSPVFECGEFLPKEQEKPLIKPNAHQWPT